MNEVVVEVVLVLIIKKGFIILLKNIQVIWTESYLV